MTRPVAVEPAPAPDPRDAADALFRDAVQARREGRAAEARSAWTRFLTAHGDDPRAGLAAFELGRLAMDVERDGAQAVASLEQALRLSPAAPFAEDALARLVQLRDQRGEHALCLELRARYLARHPHGTYVGSVSALCTR